MRIPSNTLLVLALAGLFSAGCASSLDDRIYTPIACSEGTADCDGHLSTGCETTLAAGQCCDEVCDDTQRCNGSRGVCQ